MKVSYIFALIFVTSAVPHSLEQVDPTFSTEKDSFISLEDLLDQLPENERVFTLLPSDYNFCQEQYNQSNNQKLLFQ